MVFLTSALQLGEVYNIANPKTFTVDKSGVAITKGSLLNQNKTNKNYEKCPTNGLRPFKVAAVDAAAGDVKVAVYQAPYWVAVLTTTTLDAGDLVKPSTTVSGAVERFVVGTDTDDKLVGQYKGRQAYFVQDYAGKLATGQAGASSNVVVELIH